MKKLLLALTLLLSVNIFADEVDKYITTENYKKLLIEKMLKGDSEAERVWHELEDKLQTLLEEGNIKAEKELEKWDNLLAEAGL